MDLSRTQIDEFFRGLSAIWPLKVLEADNYIDYEFTKEMKTVIFRWRPDAPEEMWFYLRENGACELEDWTELFPIEHESEHFNYLKAIAVRYLETPTRLKRRWRIFGEVRLENQEDSQWKNIRRAT